MKKQLVGFGIFITVILTACNTQMDRNEPAPSDIPDSKVDATPNPTMEFPWDRYYADGCGFQISHPISYVPPEQCIKGNTHYIGNQVEFFVGEENLRWVVCQERGLGDCPVMLNIENAFIGDKEATKINGYIGAIGGNIPQEYVTYVFQEIYDYYIFTLWALPNDAQIDDAAMIWPLREKDIEIFERMLESIDMSEAGG